MPRAGQMKERLELQREGSEIYDALGQVETLPETVATVWARVVPLSGREAVIARKQQASATHQVTIRYSSDTAGVTPEFWFLWGQRQLNIAQVINTDLRNRQLVLLCSEQTS